MIFFLDSPASYTLMKIKSCLATRKLSRRTNHPWGLECVCVRLHVSVY
jgi:hypothetical protein